MYDIDLISDAPSAEIKLTDPISKAPIGSITLAGPEHPTRKAIEFARQRKIRATLQKTGKMELPDPVEDEQANIDNLVASTLGWDLSRDGQPLPFSKSAALALYSDEKKGWLRALLFAALGERERFITSSVPA